LNLEEFKEYPFVEVLIGSIKKLIIDEEINQSKNQKINLKKIGKLIEQYKNVDLTTAT
jgi:hypothetical protein